MAFITDKGITSTSLNTYREELEVGFKAALGADLDVDPQTPQGQIIGIIALDYSTLDDAAVNLFSGLNLYEMTGNQLDAAGALFGITREAATRSTVVARLTGEPAAIIPAGSRAQTTLGDIFELVNAVTLDGSGVSNNALFQAQETGAIAIDVNTLIQIIDVVAGWETVDNLAAGDVGSDEETDTDYLQDYLDEIAKNALGTVESIDSRVSEFDGVEDVKVEENVLGVNTTIQNVTLLPHSIAVIVEGGESQSIGEAIYFSKTDGCNTAGNDLGIQTAVTIADSAQVTDPVIYYYPVVYKDISITMTIQEYETVPDVSNQIKNAIIAYFNGTFSSDIPPIGIADPSYLSRLYTPINSVGGFDVLSLEQEVLSSGTPENIITPDLNERLRITADNIDITVE